MVISTLAILIIKHFDYEADVAGKKHSDWLILGHYSPVMATGRLQASTPKQKGHVINNLLTSKVNPFIRKSLHWVNTARSWFEYSGCQRFFFSLGATELSSEAAKASREEKHFKNNT